jgi:hypothetical protein
MADFAFSGAEPSGFTIREIVTYVRTHKLVIIISSSSSTVLVRTFAAPHRMFRNLIKTRGRTPLDE